MFCMWLRKRTNLGWSKWFWRRLRTLTFCGWCTLGTRRLCCGSVWITLWTCTSTCLIKQWVSQCQSNIFVLAWVHHYHPLCAFIIIIYKYCLQNIYSFSVLLSEFKAVHLHDLFLGLNEREIQWEVLQHHITAYCCSYLNRTMRHLSISHASLVAQK